MKMTIWEEIVLFFWFSFNMTKFNWYAKKLGEGMSHKFAFKEAYNYNKKKI